MDKMKQTLESENVDMANEIKQLTASKQESERKRKQLETAVQEANIKYVEIERSRSDLIEKVQKLQVSLLVHYCSLECNNKSVCTMYYSNDLYADINSILKIACNHTKVRNKSSTKLISMAS